MIALLHAAIAAVSAGLECERLREVVWTLTLVTCVSSPSAHASIVVTDDRGDRVELPAPAKRIVSLAPHITELLFAAGAGDHVVGTTDFSDYPLAAKRIARVGNSSHLDLERIVYLKPDLIVVWWHGTSELQLDRLRGFGIPMFYEEPHALDDLPRTIREFGTLAGTEPQARVTAEALSARLSSLRSRYADRPRLRVFWQVWERPLLTINGRHFVNDVIRLCGGVNVFEQLSPLIPSVSIEAVIAARPDAIVTTTDGGADGGDGLDMWRRFSWLPATAQHNLIVLNAETIHRATPRILDGAAALCERLEVARSRGKP